MTSVAVVAHARKQLGDGLPELRRLLERRGFDAPIWHEVQKSKQAPKRVEKALAAGADLVFAWGGDGTVQRCIDAHGRLRRHARDPPGRHRQPPRQQPRRSPPTSRPRSTSACTAPAAGSTPAP